MQLDQFQLPCPERFGYIPLELDQLHPAHSERVGFIPLYPTGLRTRGHSETVSRSYPPGPLDSIPLEVQDKASRYLKLFFEIWYNFAGFTSWRYNKIQLPPSLSPGSSCLT